ncbi:MAG: OadG family protein [Candidatus Didemnitutus sp.]|nr:OadG family protein [Candidatus Didemnitutus sp.]
MPTLVSLPVAAALAEKPSVLETLGYQLNGMIVVFLALASIWLFLEIVGRFFKRSAAAQSAAAVAAPAAPVAATAPVPAAPAPSRAPAVPAGLAPELLAAITVAVHVTLGDRARVQAIVPVPLTQAWAHDGRRQIFASHQPR